MKILLIEDNEAIVKNLEYALVKENYEIKVAFTLKEAKMILAQEPIALIILDVSLPDGNGFDFYENVIQKQNIATIFLTAKDGEDEIVKGLNMGADDYLTKPFRMKELLARINKIFLKSKSQTIIKVQDISFDLDKMLVYKNNQVIDLTPLEIKLLQLLFLNLNKVVNRNTILETIWDITGNDVDNHTITVYFKRIRTKLGSDIIKTIKGIGYRIDNE